MPFRRATLVACLAVIALGLGLAAGPGTALADPGPPGGGDGSGGSGSGGSGAPGRGFDTVAALPPSLTTGRGASVAFVEQEAENAATNGHLIGPDRNPYTLASEASGRMAVQLDSAGQYVEFTLSRDTNAINFRYSIPDAPSGGGIVAPLTVLINGKHAMTATLTSQYSWLYSTYPFSNDPMAAPPADWWIPESRPVTHPFRPSHFYDEQRLLLGKTYRAGDKIRLQVPERTNAAWYVIDLMDFENVARPANRPPGSLSVVTFGADSTGARDSAAAFDAAIAAAKAQHKTVFIPKGTFQINRHIIVDDVTLEGAGSWHSIIRGHLTTITRPDGGTEQTGPGFYGKSAEEGGSINVHLSNFAIESDVRSRVDTDQVNGVGGAIGGGSTIEGLYIHHTKVGMWFDGPFSGLTVKNNVIVDQIADALNLRKGISNVRVTNNFIRNTGDDGLAMWSDGLANHDNSFDHNTVQTPVLANGIAIYGGRDNAVTDNLVADPIREGSGLHAGQRFGATAFAGTLTFARNTTVRAAPRDLNWNIGLGAIWFYALEGSMTSRIDVTDSSFLDNTYNAIMFVVDWPVKDKYVINNVHFTNIKVDGTGTSVVNARVGGWATFQNVFARNVGAAGVNNCGTFHFTGIPEFQVIDLGGNGGRWLNTTTCDDRPPVVPPPPPSPW